MLVSPTIERSGANPEIALRNLSAGVVGNHQHTSLLATRAGQATTTLLVMPLEVGDNITDAGRVTDDQFLPPFVRLRYLDVAK